MNKLNNDIGQMIEYRTYTTHQEHESGKSATYTRTVKDYEDFDEFVNRVTEKANTLNGNQMVLSISYPTVNIAVIAYKNI